MASQIFDYVAKSAFKVRGLIRANSDSDVVLVDDAALGVRVLLTGKVNDHLANLDRQSAIAGLTLEGLVGKQADADFDANAERRVHEAKTERTKFLNGEAAVLVEFRGTAEARVEGNARQIGNLLICIDAVDKRAVIERARPIVAAALAGMRMLGGDKYEFLPLVSGVELVDEAGSPVHSLTFEGGRARVHVSRPLTPERTVELQSATAAALRAIGLQWAMQLHVQSLDEQADAVRSFVLAWAALEVFVGSVVRHYQDLMSPSAASKLTAAHHSACPQIAEVVEGRRGRLIREFASVSHSLDPDQFVKDVASFERVKALRNGFLHGDAVTVEALPTAEVNALMEKYLGRHLGCRPPGSVALQVQ